MKDTIEERLNQQGLLLPEPATPLASYIPTKQVGNLLYISGQISMEKGKVITGRMSSHREEDMVLGQTAAQSCALSILAQAKKYIGTLDHIISVVKLGGFVNCTSDFIEIPKVINGASEVMVEAFGEKGRHVRFAVGCASLPLNALVEVEAVLEVK